MTAAGDRPEVDPTEINPSEINPSEEPHSVGPEAPAGPVDAEQSASGGSSTEQEGMTATAAAGEDPPSEADLAAAASYGAAHAEPAGADSNDRSDEVAELTEDLKRVTAEYTNYRRRVSRDRDVAVAEAKAKVLAGLLEIADELGMAAQHGDLAAEGPLRSFNDKFFAVLAGQGVVEFGEPGDDFDPNLHEAVQDSSDGADPKVDTVLRKGYRIDDRVLRTAMVIVGA